MGQVRDLEAAKDLFRDALGFALPPRGSNFGHPLGSWQVLARFRARLGVPVAAFHSGLADGERARAWAAMASGHARVLVGTRSAVFCPLPEAGLLVVDEEHDGSYKQQDGVRYHARDLALVRARALGVPVLLGSATATGVDVSTASTGTVTFAAGSSSASGTAIFSGLRLITTTGTG